ncbi:hypothetical protein WA538_001503, partial [Blastocystis sp. DL]
FEKWHCYRFERRYYLNNDGLIHKMLESLYAASDESALDPEHLHGNHAESPICPVVWRSLDADRISWSVVIAVARLGRFDLSAVFECDEEEKDKDEPSQVEKEKEGEAIQDQGS